MNENLNLVEILKDCPKGTTLYSPVYEYVELVSVSLVECAKYPIEIKDRYGVSDGITKDGRIYEEFHGECMLFPSKEQRDWSKFRIKKPKFDPKTLKPFDKVLIKKGTESYNLWFPDFISLPFSNVDEKIFCMNTDDVVMAIPYNEETKHLVDTNEEAPEFYRYWDE